MGTKKGAQKRQQSIQLASPPVEEVSWDLCSEVEQLLQKKSELLKSLAVTESKIYKLETSYLTDNVQYGNIVKGYNLDPFAEGLEDILLGPAGSQKSLISEKEGNSVNERIDSKAAETVQAHPVTRSRRQSNEKAYPMDDPLPESDRIFSNTSMTYQQSLKVVDHYDLRHTKSAQTSNASSRSISPMFDLSTQRSTSPKQRKRAR